MWRNMRLRDGVFFETYATGNQKKAQDGRIPDSLAAFDVSTVKHVGERGKSRTPKTSRLDEDLILTIPYRP